MASPLTQNMKTFFDPSDLFVALSVPRIPQTNKKLYFQKLIRTNTEAKHNH
jgi:hypothetical protein